MFLTFSTVVVIITAFFVAFANGFLGHTPCLGPVQTLFRPVLTFQRFETFRTCKAVPLTWQLQLHFEVAPFILLFTCVYNVLLLALLAQQYIYSANIYGALGMCQVPL